MKRQKDNTNKYVFLKETDNDSRYKILEARGGVHMAKDDGN